MSDNFIVEKSKDGYDILKVKIDDKWKYIGSSYNQKREIDKFIDNFGCLTENDNYIILGLSLGEHIRELLKVCNKDSHLFVIEPNEELVKTLQKENKIDDILENDKVTVCTTNEEIKKILPTFINETNVDFLKLGVYSNYIKLYDKLVYYYKTVKEYVQRILLYRNTSLVNSNIWFNTLMGNLNEIVKSTPLNILENQYKNKPAIIVSAGPSLSKNIDYLKEIDGRALILSGGRTLRPLVEKNIEPDCLVVVDPGKVSYDLVKDYIGNVKCPLLFYDGTNSNVVNSFIGKNIISTHNKFIHKIFNKEIENINKGGSVAHSMTYFAAYMGCNPIIFIGQDLAYTDEKSHADIALNKYKFTTFEDYKSDDDLYVKDIEGRDVRTSIVLNSFKIELEDIIKSFPEIEFIDSTEGGAYIEGTKIKTLKEVIESLDNNKVEVLDKFLDTEIDKSKEAIVQLENSLKLMKQCKGNCSEGITLLRKYRNAYMLKNIVNMNNINKLLGKIDKNLKNQIDELQFLESVLFDVIYKINSDIQFVVLEDDSEKAKIEKQLSKNRTIYEEINKTLDRCIPKVQQTLESLKNN